MAKENNYYTSSSEATHYTPEQYETLKQEFDWTPHGMGNYSTGFFLTGWYDAYSFYQYAGHAKAYAANLDVLHCSPNVDYIPRGLGHNDCRDAFRHAYWNALMATHSESDAKQIGDSHERTSVGPYKETYMDLYNNKVGREIGAANANKRHEEIAALVEQALAEGRLITSTQSVPETEPAPKMCPVPETEPAPKMCSVPETEPLFKFTSKGSVPETKK